MKGVWKLLKAKDIVFSGTSITCGSLVLGMEPEMIQGIISWIIVIIGIISAVLSIVNTVLKWYNEKKEKIDSGGMRVEDYQELISELHKEIDRYEQILMIEKEEDKDVSQDK